MKELIIVGAGGFGRELYNYAQGSIGYGKDFIIKGFLDFNQHALDRFCNYPPILGNDVDYEIQNDDVFVLAIGNVRVKQKSIVSLTNRGAIFYTLIHKTAIINSNVEMGDGCVIMPHAVIGSDAKIGSHTLIQANAVVAHDVKIGECCRLDCFTTCVGGVIIGNFVTLHTSSVINHKVKIGDFATVGACSFVIRNVQENATVFGVPAVTLKS